MLAYICKALDFKLRYGDGFSLGREDDTDLDLLFYSDRFFKEEWARSCRAFLLTQIPGRHDFRAGGKSNIDIYKTRFLLDSHFQAADEWSFLQRCYDRLPANCNLMYAIFKALLHGCVFTNARWHAAGLCAEPVCLHCGQLENHDHIFQHCPFYDDTRPDYQYTNLTWKTGIFAESEAVRKIRQEDEDRQSSSTPPFEAVAAEYAFTDGSCFYDSWAPLRTSASAVVFPGIASYAELLPGGDQSSVRAEIHAVFLTLALSKGDITIASDCAHVVNTFTWLQANNWSECLLRKLDSRDVWDMVHAALLDRDPGTVRMLKVKAHVTRHSSVQPREEYGSRTAGREVYFASTRNF